MDRANKFKCPHCGTPLKSSRGVRIGRTIKCLKCEAPFTVGPEDAEQVAGVNGSRLCIVLAGALLYLLGGGALAVYCFSVNAQPRVAASDPGTDGIEDDSSEPPPPLPPGPAGVDPAEQRRIDNAIADGVWFLKKKILANGTWSDTIPNVTAGVSVGFASLPALTLLECGVPANDPVVQQAAVFVRNQAPTLGNTYDTYQRSLAILFLDRLGDSRDEALIQYLALCLIAGQRADDHGWGYSCPTLDPKLTPQLVQQLRDDRQTMNLASSEAANSSVSVKMLQDNKQALDKWRQTALKGQAFDPGRSDNSNTQFATLALWVAQRHGVSIDRTIVLVKNRFTSTQLPKGPDPTGNNLDLDGAWPYNPEAGATSNPWPTMTCAGLLGLAVAHGIVTAERSAKDKPLEDQAIKRGLAALGREIARPGEKRALDFYFLWSLERVGVLYNLSKIGDKDWYAWGRKALLDRQQKDGSWKDGAYYGNNPLIDTCFALLFLKQANLAKDLTSKLQLLSEKK
jgi:hypothetical protein